jgi:hypothetical protein
LVIEISSIIATGHSEPLKVWTERFGNGGILPSEDMTLFFSWEISYSEVQLDIGYEDCMGGKNSSGEITTLK